MENSNIGNGGNMSGYTDKKRYAFLYISAVFFMMFIFIFVIYREKCDRKNDFKIIVGEVYDKSPEAADIILNQAFELKENTKLKTNGEVFYPKGFFEDCMIEFPSINKIVFTNKIGTVKNELTEYRYDAILFVNCNSVLNKKNKKKMQFGLSF